MNESTHDVTEEVVMRELTINELENVNGGRDGNDKDEDEEEDEELDPCVEGGCGYHYDVP